MLLLCFRACDVDSLQQYSVVAFPFIFPFFFLTPGALLFIIWAFLFSGSCVVVALLLLLRIFFRYIVWAFSLPHTQYTRTSFSRVDDYHKTTRSPSDLF